MQPEPRPSLSPAVRFDFFGADRLRGLPPEASALLRHAARSLAGRDIDGAERSLLSARELAPEHPETLRVYALVERGRGRFAVAAGLMQRALAVRPGDPLLLGDMAALASERGDAQAALGWLREATLLAPTHVDMLFRLAVQLDRNARSAEALGVAERVLGLAPSHPHAAMLVARGLQACGRIDEAASAYRRIARAGGARAWQAWFSLVDLKTIRLDVREQSELERLADDPSLDQEARTTLGFALGKVLEDAGRHAEAFAAFERANGEKRRSVPWDASALSDHVKRSIEAFRHVSHAAPDGLGKEIIFIVGMPRSGTTLVEQILAAHPQVEGASELPDLPAVLAGESGRRGVPIHAWATDATSEDWERLGIDYLERTSRWRDAKPLSTDKLPDNWTSIGAIRAMLPAARIIDCRRDAVETCWSCYKQLFAPGRATYSYDLQDLAHYFLQYDDAMRHWKAIYPDRIVQVDHAALVAHPHVAIRSLLDACALPFDDACLDFTQAARAVRTPSAVQVRQGIRSDTARASLYGGQLETLRRALRLRAEPDR